MLVGAAVAQSSATSNTIDSIQNHFASNQAEIEELAVSKVTETSDPSKTKEIVQAYFKDAPILVDVAYCESRFRQYDESGNAMRGWINAKDVGVMQINEDYHLETANKLGYDIYTLEGNLSYARYLYETQGTRPWVHSSPCWNSSAHVASL